MPEHTPAPTPARSLYGFFMYLFSKTILFLYCLWAFIPDYYLHSLNIYYYPQKYWSTAIPIQCLIALTIFAFLIYPSSNLILTSRIDSVNTIYDSYSQSICASSKPKYKSKHKCVCQDDNKCYKDKYLASSQELKENVVPHLQDLDVRYVSRKLYFNKKIL